jgi:uncharacterized protein (DUF885 family)
MRWVWRAIELVAALAVLAAFYLGYLTAFGRPLTFNTLLDRQAVYEAVHHPQLLTMIGIIDGTWFDFHSDKLDAYSLDDRARAFDRLRGYEAEVRTWDRAKLSPKDQLSYDYVLWLYDRTLDDARYPWLGADRKVYPVNQAFGEQRDLPNFVLTQHAITNLKLARHYVERLRALGTVIDAINGDITRQEKAGVVAPDFIIAASVEQMRTLIAAAPDKNPLVTNLTDKTASLGDVADARGALIGEATAVVKDNVYPAYRRLIAREEAILPHAGHDAGLWRLKSGGAYYADQLKLLTSTDMTPDEIHAFGLKEVQRITGELDIALKAVGLANGAVGERIDTLMADPRFLFKNTDDDRAKMLATYKRLLDRVHGLLPLYFAHVPTLPLDVERVPPFAEKGSAGAYYQQPSLDGSRPGVFFANLRNTGETPEWAMPTLAYHEGIPGHHLQIATALEITDLPLLRRVSFLPAYGEGWALYAEHLAYDIGLYKGSPYGNIGRLQAELFRAVRLVVDTGMHAKHWSREQAISYMQTTTGMAPSDVKAEIERYVVWPGQACSYKIGMKTILSLREKARESLGPKFDLKEFHKVVLENGALPLWLLQKNVDHWLAEKEGLRQ